MGRRTEEQKKYHRESMARYYAADPEKFKKRVRRWQKANRAKRLVVTNRWRENNRAAARAHYAVADAIKAGKLQRPTVCEGCGTVTRTEAHHHKGYAKEFRLDVVWLCAQCHTDIHKEFLLS